MELNKWLVTTLRRIDSRYRSGDPITIGATNNFIRSLERKGLVACTKHNTPALFKYVLTDAGRAELASRLKRS